MHANLKSAALAAVLAVGVFGCCEAIAEGDAAIVQLLPVDLKWVDNPGLPARCKTAVLSGVPGKPGPYTFRIKIPVNTVIHAHFSPDDRTYTVISGTWYVGHGDAYDAAKLQRMPPGSFYVRPAKVPSYDVAREEEVIIQISGNGPTGLTYIDASNDPRKK
jgi:hypothetical protein